MEHKIYWSEMWSGKKKKEKKSAPPSPSGPYWWVQSCVTVPVRCSTERKTFYSSPHWLHPSIKLMFPHSLYPHQKQLNQNRFSPLTSHRSHLIAGQYRYDRIKTTSHRSDKRPKSDTYHMIVFIIHSWYIFRLKRFLFFSFLYSTLYSLWRLGSQVKNTHNAHDITSDGAYIYALPPPFS